METAPENARGLHAIAVLKDKKDFTLSSLRDAAYDSWLPAFDRLVPLVIRAWDALPAGDPLRAKLAEQIATLRAWDHRWSAESVATSLAVFWGERLWQSVRGDRDSDEMLIHEAIASKTTPAQQLEALAKASDKLAADFGKWQTPWGEINRFQRLTGDIVQPFRDDGPSIAVPFTSATWGSLASFGARAHRGSKKIYGTSGNSFVAVVEFGDTVKARAVTAGGVNCVPGSKHFNDQAELYANGALREVYFYPSQLQGHTERVYRPGTRQ
jgi:acyl-homoserine-lactone acylase